MKSVWYCLTLFLVATQSINAQQQSLYVTYFQIDQNVHVEATNLHPNSRVDYYTTSEGGFLQSSMTASKEGTAQYQVDSAKLPAFVLNERYVKHLGEREFLLGNLHAQYVGNHVLIQWNGAASNIDKLQYVVLRSQDGKLFEPVYKVPVLSSAPRDFSFLDAYHPSQSYRLAVVKDKTVERYRSPILRVEGEADFFSLYPTLTNDRVHIDLKEAVTPIRYQVFSLQGSVILKGSLEEINNIVDVSSLTSGTYFFELNWCDNRRIVKVVKY